MPLQIFPDAAVSELNMLCVCRACKNRIGDDDILTYLKDTNSDLQTKKKLVNIAKYVWYLSQEKQEADLDRWLDNGGII
jgi:hypothetical protein